VSDTLKRKVRAPSWIRCVFHQLESDIDFAIYVSKRLQRMRLAGALRGLRLPQDLRKVLGLPVEGYDCLAHALLERHKLAKGAGVY